MLVSAKNSPISRSVQIGLLGLLVGIGLGACSNPIPKQTQPGEVGSAPAAPTRQEKKVILTTFTVLADMAQNVAGDKATVESITKPGAEIHGYEPTPSDLVRGQRADLILDNGLDLERWAARFYNSFPKVPHVTLSEGVQPVNITEDAYQGKPNPHAWMSPQNALIYVENIRKALSNLDPANTATYSKNAATYSQQIRAIDQKLKRSLSAIPATQRYMVSCEGAFSYIVRDYGLKEVYIWPVNAEQQATPKQVERVITSVRANQIPAVFCESTVSNEAQLQVAKETGAKFAGVFYVDSLSPPDGPASTYLKLLEYNINTLIEGLRGGESKN
ncbi:metal ABC transporter substrate-binding protein [Kovacikia minuta CCNUW1]|uniref:metal ABC transporter substrate-binding protein n=1 Tax=Kovacikia minuta TaxID=2931930 RepID=UPI001CCEB3BE|nr:metal ABC transporter substrate-binding protein [Kovacikia minuta]UBF26858.1 metal ABC transporter substrate-binding protein [Kovacikia minuta CCNUW1]